MKMKQRKGSIQSEQFRIVMDRKNSSCYITHVATSWSTIYGSLYSNTDGKLYMEKRRPFAEMIVNPD
jgi:hypothetical protein